MSNGETSDDRGLSRCVLNNKSTRLLSMEDEMHGILAC